MSTEADNDLSLEFDYYILLSMRQFPNTDGKLAILSCCLLFNLKHFCFINQIYNSIYES